MIFQQGKAIAEALLFASAEPLSAKKVAELIGLEERAARDLIEDLRKDYQSPGRGLEILEVAGGYKIATRPELSGFVEKLAAERGSSVLSHAALETLAIIAYRQPVTRAEVEAIRGVSIDKSLSTLLERRLVKEVGRKEGPGRPILYGTTKEFLMYFGLKDLSQLPPIDQFGGKVPDLPDQAPGEPRATGTSQADFA